MTKVFRLKSKNLTGILTAASVLSLLTSFSVAHPAQAQYIGTNSKEAVQSTSATQAGPLLPGSQNGTLGPQDADATAIQGVNTAGTVRVNMLANVEALLNIGANGTEIVGIIWGALLMLAAFTRTPKNKRTRLAVISLALIAGGLATPAVMNWSVAAARDANLFS